MLEELAGANVRGEPRVLNTCVFVPPPRPIYAGRDGWDLRRFPDRCVFGPRGPFRIQMAGQGL